MNSLLHGLDGPTSGAAYMMDASCLGEAPANTNLQTKPRVHHRKLPPPPKQAINMIKFASSKSLRSDEPASNYFRPRPRLDSEWFQMPKPPRLAYQREQFFAQLVKSTEPPKKSRRGKRSKATTKQADQIPEDAGNPPTSGVKSTARPKSRIEFGFAGHKMTSKPTNVRPKTVQGWAPEQSPDSSFTRPKVQILQPEEAEVQGLSLLETPFQCPKTSVISLQAMDAQPLAPEAEMKYKQQYYEMRIMGDIHNRELKSMKHELHEMRTALEASMQV